MEKIAFVMQLNEGCEAEYQRRHDAIWPELETALKEAGVSDYSIFLHPQTRQLFATLWREDNHGMDELPATPVMQKWWSYMKDIMAHNADGSPVSLPLKQVFHLQ